MQIRNNSQSADMDSFIEISETNSLQFQNSSFFRLIKGVAVEELNVLRDVYYAQLVPLTEIYTILPEEFSLYKYRPKALSAKLFGTIDYWYIILLLNNMTSHLDFKLRAVRVPTFDCIREIKRILTKEEIGIKNNNENL